MELNVFKLILQAGPVVKLVMLILAGFSIVSWAIIFSKYRTFRRSRKLNADFLNYFWDQRNLEDAFRKAKQLTECPMARVYKAGYTEFKRFQETIKANQLRSADTELVNNTERALKRSIAEEADRLSQRSSFLATTGSSTPFIGLFGTVWGIMNSFLNIGALGTTNLAVVAPGISEALVATALGLFAAIPAVIGYNYAVAQVRKLQKEMEFFSDDLLNNLTRLSA